MARARSGSLSSSGSYPVGYGNIHSCFQVPQPAEAYGHGGGAKKAFVLPSIVLRLQKEFPQPETTVSGLVLKGHAHDEAQDIPQQHQANAEQRPKGAEPEEKFKHREDTVEKFHRFLFPRSDNVLEPGGLPQHRDNAHGFVMHVALAIRTLTGHVVRKIGNGVIAGASGLPHLG